MSIIKKPEDNGYLNGILSEQISKCEIAEGLFLDDASLKNLKRNSKMLTLFTGENGTGKTKLLNYIRDSIQNYKLNIFPFKIIRLITFGEEMCDFQPDGIIKSFDDSLNEYCSFQNWENLYIENLIKNKELKKDSIFKIYFYKYYYEIISENELKSIKKESENEKKKLFGVFKENFKKQIPKILWIGNIEQLLSLNDQKEIDEINKFIKNNKYMNFDFKIVKTNKSYIKDCISFNSGQKKKLKLKDLSHSERLTLSLLLILKEKDIIMDSNINQILLLDEPDRDCEFTLLEKVLDIIQKELIGNLNIQVIITTNNIKTITLLGKIPNVINNCMFMLSKKNDNTIELLNDRNKAMDLLPKEISTNFFNFDLSYSNSLIYRCLIDFAKKINNTKILGYLLESLFSNKFKDKNLEKDFLNLLGLNTESYNFKFKQINNLKNIQVQDSIDSLNSLDYIVYWPKDSQNPAWDFIILGKKEIYFYQLTIRRDIIEKANDTIEKHIKEYSEFEEDVDEYIKKENKFYFLIHGNNMTDEKNYKKKDIDINLQLICIDEFKKFDPFNQYNIVLESTVLHKSIKLKNESELDKVKNMFEKKSLTIYFKKILLKEFYEILDVVSDENGKIIYYKDCQINYQRGVKFTIIDEKDLRIAFE